MIDPENSKLGFVVIGRNEGLRLKRCLESLRAAGHIVVYVDSGSTDDSVPLARMLGAHVLDLDMSRPFTASRARNAGLHRLQELEPGISFVQFIDGDCELLPGWIDAALAYSSESADCAAVSGRLRERAPEASWYNRLCDMEWDGPVGEIEACGGIALMRVSAFEAVEGFRDDLIAGEEPELCFRLRRAGWSIVRLPADMALHDAAMTRLSQWGRRTMRAGFTFAQAASLHGDSPERHGVRRMRSALTWGIAIPLFGLTMTLLLGPAALAIFLIYPLQALRLALREGRSPRDNLLRGAFLVMGKVPEAVGVIKFYVLRWLDRRPMLIEYK